VCFYFFYFLAWSYFTCFVTTVFSIKWNKVILLGWYRPWVEDHCIIGLRILHSRNLRSWGHLSSRHGKALFVLSYIVCLSNGSSLDCVQFWEFWNSQLTIQLSVLFPHCFLTAFFVYSHELKYVFCTVFVFLLVTIASKQSLFLVV